MGAKIFGVLFMLSNGSGSVVDESVTSITISGFWSILKYGFRWVGQQIADIFATLLDVILKLLYIVAEYALKTLDLIYIFFKELAGMNQNVTLLNTDELLSSDMIYTFVTSEAVVGIIKRMFGLAIVLLILFSIVAIVKAEYTSAVTDGSNSKKEVLVNSLRAIFVMFMVPILAFGGILFSNAVLASVSSAFGMSGDVKMGTTVFLSASYEANKFRIYADSNVMIPITYELESVDEEKLKNMPTDGTKAEVEAAFNKLATAPAWNIGYATYTQFCFNKFFERNNVPNSYYAIYDKNLSPNGNFAGGKAINSYVDKTDYYVMADLQDTLLKYNIPYYYQKVANPITVKYLNGNNVVFTPKAGASSEEEGAVFSITIRPTIIILKNGGVTEEKLGDPELIVSGQKMYYYKVYNGSISDGNLNTRLSKSFVFNSDYLKDGSNVLAKGFMSDEGYPTTIKENANGEIVFYRDKINIPMLADFFPQITYEENPDKVQFPGSIALKYGVQYLTGVDPDDLIPYIYFRFDIWTFYEKTEVTVGNISGKEPIVLDYMFEGLNIENFYSLTDLNWLVFVIVASVLLGVLLKSCFGLVGRIFDVVVLMVIYPVVASLMPIDGGDRAKAWNGEFIGRLFTAYGIVISMNFVFLMTPLIQDIKIFEQGMLTGIMSSEPAPFVNFVIQALFILVLFTFIKTGPTVISQLLGESKDMTINAYTIGESNLAAVIGTRDEIKGNMKGGLLGDARDIISGKNMKDRLASDSHFKFLPSKLTRFLPGGNVIKKFADKKASKRYKEGILGDSKKLMGQMKAGSVDKDKFNKKEKQTKEMKDNAQKTMKGLAPKSPWKFQ